MKADLPYPRSLAMRDTVEFIKVTAHLRSLPGGMPMSDVVQTGQRGHGRRPGRKIALIDATVGVLSRNIPAIGRGCRLYRPLAAGRLGLQDPDIHGAEPGRGDALFWRTMPRR